MESAQSAVSEPLQDAFALAILNTVAANPPLLELVNGPRPIDRPQLRRAVKDYSGIDWSHATTLRDAYFWCVRCAETGVFAAVQTSLVDRPLFCCKCGREVPYMAAFYSTGPLAQALEHHDGVLAAALAWHLTQREIAFDDGVKLPNTELDFVLKGKAGDCLIECQNESYARRKR